MRLASALTLGVALTGLAATSARAEETPAAAAPAAKAELWSDNFVAAKAKAAKENKDILIDFTGSDWCGWCIKLKSEVFSTPEFEAAAPKTFVLVEADFPKDKKKIAPEVRMQNEQLMEAFGVQGFPTIFLLDAQGRPYAKTGYQPGGPDAYLKHLAGLQATREKRDAAWKKADAAQGVEKAKLLAEGLAALDKELVAAHYASVIAEIAKLDPEDVTGTKQLLLQAKLTELASTVVSTYRKTQNAAAAAKVVDDFIAANKPAGESLQAAMFAKLNLYPPNSVTNIEKAMTLMDEIAVIAPESEMGKRAASIKKQAAGMKDRMEAMERARAQRAEEAKKAAEAPAPAPAAAAPAPVPPAAPAAK